MKASLTCSYLCCAPGPFHWEVIKYTFSLLGRALLNTPWISKQKRKRKKRKGILQCQEKKETMARKKKSAATCGCATLRREPPICAERLGSEATKETCSRTPVSWREQFASSISSVQHCSSHVQTGNGKAQRSSCRVRNSTRSRNVLRNVTTCWKFDEDQRWHNVCSGKKKKV